MSATTSSKVLTDAEIIEKHDRSIRARARIELQIVNQLIASAAAAGYMLKVREYEEAGETGYDVKTAVFNLDDAHVTVHDATGKRLGFVYLVFGNDGYDLISNYSVSLETFLADCNRLADSLG